MTRLLYQVHHALRNFHVDVEQELLDGIMLALGERKKMLILLLTMFAYRIDS